jgi:alcohol dehydrogenase
MRRRRPPPGPGEVQIRIKAVALNHIDVWGFRGMAFRQAQAAAVVGAEAAGEIASRRAPASPRFRAGDKVVMYGALTCGIAPPAARAATICARTSPASWASTSTALPAI